MNTWEFLKQLALLNEAHYVVRGFRGEEKEEKGTMEYDGGERQKKETKERTKAGLNEVEEEESWWRRTQGWRLHLDYSTAQGCMGCIKLWKTLQVNYQRPQDQLPSCADVKCTAGSGKKKIIFIKN